MAMVLPRVAAAIGSSIALSLHLEGAASQGSNEHQVRLAEDERRGAILRNDTAALDRMIAASFVGTLDDGRTTTKTDELAVNRASDRKVESWESSEVVVRVYGDTAVVTGRATVKDRLRDEGVRNFAFRFTHVWTKLEGRWQLVGRHISGRSVPRSPAAIVRMVPAGQARIEVHIRGVGHAVILLPSVGGASQFDEVAPLLAAAGFQTIAMSFRGAGRSTGPLEGLTLHDYAADVAAVIEALGVAPAHVLGRTGGNRVARCLARDRPDLVKSVILVAAGGLVPGDPNAEAWVNAGPNSLPESQRLAAFQSFMLSPATDPARAKRIYDFFPSWPAAGKAFMAANAATPVAEWWAAGGRVPMLVIQGLDDIIAPPGNGRALHDQFRDRVTLVEIPHAAHALLFEQPERIAAEIVTFLKTHP